MKPLSITETRRRFASSLYPRRVRHKQTAGELDVLKAVSNVDSQLRDRGRQLIVNLCLEGVFGGHKRPLRREKGRALRAHERGFIYW